MTAAERKQLARMADKLRSMAASADSENEEYGLMDAVAGIGRALADSDEY